MEPTEIHEFSEHLKEASEPGGESLKSISLAISILAVLVAMVTVLGHRTHTEAVLLQSRAGDQWNEYQAKKIRSYNTGLSADLLSLLTVGDKEAAAKIVKGYADHQTKWNEDLKEQQAKAEEFEKKVDEAEARANRFDLGETLLEIGLVVTSVTLLTKSRIYWYFSDQR